MSAGKKAVKKVVKKAVQYGIKDPIKKPGEELIRGGKRLLTSVSKTMRGGPDVDPGLSEEQIDLQRQQAETEASQESELAKKKALLKRRSTGRGSLLSGSALGVQDTLG